MRPHSAALSRVLPGFRSPRDESRSSLWLRPECSAQHVGLLRACPRQCRHPLESQTPREGRPARPLQTPPSDGSRAITLRRRPRLLRHTSPPAKALSRPQLCTMDGLSRGQCMTVFIVSSTERTESQPQRSARAFPRAAGRARRIDSLARPTAETCGTGAQLGAMGQACWPARQHSTGPRLDLNNAPARSLATRHETPRDR
jgi:hypothetical protein